MSRRIQDYEEHLWQLNQRTEEKPLDEMARKYGQTRYLEANRFIIAPPTDGGKARVPALKSTDAAGNQIEIRDNADKSKLLHKVFFYDPPADSGIAPNHAYPDERFPFRRITNDHIKR